MRRCGRASCLFGMGLLAATIVAGGAFAAPGGNGKGHVGRGLALAKGHAKRAAATPQSSPVEAETPPQAKAEPPAMATPKGRPSAAPGSRGEEQRAEHLTICHRTGSGRYIVISPSVTGAVNGHLKHHDDFVYTGSCSSPPPSGDVGGSPPDDPPPVATHPPRDPPSPETAPPPASPRGDLPFTGVPALYLLVAGGMLLAAGLVLRRPRVLPQRNERVDRRRA